MVTRALLVLTVAVAAVLGTAHGASYTVGAPAGSWDLRTNYTSWASGINFRAGDQLGTQSLFLLFVTNAWSILVYLIVQIYYK
jgi:hypothetical protein